MTIAEFRAMVLALPETVEASHFGDVSFKAGKRLFATVSDGGLVMLGVPQRERIPGMIAALPDVFEHVGKYTDKYGAIGVRLETVDPLLMRDLITDSWASVASKRAQKALAAQNAKP